MNKPCGWRIAIQVEEALEKTESGIILAPDSITKRATDKGTVLAVGDLCWKDQKFMDCEPWCKVGDRILFVRYAGNRQEDPITGEGYTLINDEDVLQVLEKETKDVGNS